jgi:hypothetical protein
VKASPLKSGRRRDAWLLRHDEGNKRTSSDGEEVMKEEGGESEVDGGVGVGAETCMDIYMHATFIGLIL